MHPFFVSGRGWSGRLYEYDIATHMSWVLMWRSNNGEAGHNIFTEQTALDQWMDELDIQNDDFPNYDQSDTEFAEALQFENI